MPPVRRGFRSCAILAAFLCAGSAAAQDLAPPTQPAESAAPPVALLAADDRGQAARLADAALSGSGAFDVARALTVEVGPRLAGSAGDRAAVVWGLRALPGLGLRNVRAEEVTVPHWERGTASGWITAPYPQPVALTALGGSVGTSEEGIAAEVVRLDSLAALRELPSDALKGKIVFFDVAMERTPDGTGYGRAVGVRGRGASEAAKRGAAAVLIRSIGTDRNRLPHTGALRYAEDAPRIPAAALSGPDADLLAAQVASGRPVAFRLLLTARLLSDAVSSNVVGEIPGREAPEEIVLLGCHLDSWDLGTGAQDDAAGCAIVLAAARLLGELPRPPRRTVRVVLFANEEFGLSGARAYAAAHAAELGSHVVAAEADSGAGRVWRFATRVAPEALGLAAEIAAVLAPLGIEPGGNEANGGADIGPLRRLGVPVVSLQQDMSGYFDVHHTANDTLDKIGPTDLDQPAAAFAAFAFLAAEAPTDFGRLPPETDSPF